MNNQSMMPSEGNGAQSPPTTAPRGRVLSCLSPSLQQGLRRWGRFLFEGAHYRDAAAIQRLLVLSKPQDVAAWYLLGRSLAEAGRFEAAQRAFELGAHRGAAALFCEAGLRLSSEPGSVSRSNAPVRASSGGAEA